MKTIYFRDDDISFFTHPDKLDRIYGRLWENNIPVNLAVIPMPRGDVRVLHRDGHPFDPGIPVELRGQSREFPLMGNGLLCNFLNMMAQKRLIEVCLHGYHHLYHEFDDESPKIVASKLDAGKRELRQALPNAIIDTFISPYDRISPTAFEMISARSYNIATNTSTLNNTDFETMKAHELRTMDTGKQVYTGDDYFFSHHRAPQDCIDLALKQLHENDTVMVTNHYWTFFYDWGAEWHEMLNAWDQFVDELLRLPDVQFKMFSDPAIK